MVKGVDYKGVVKPVTLGNTRIPYHSGMGVVDAEGCICIVIDILGQRCYLKEDTIYLIKGEEDFICYFELPGEILETPYNELYSKLPGEYIVEINRYRSLAESMYNSLMENVYPEFKKQVTSQGLEKVDVLKEALECFETSKSPYNIYRKLQRLVNEFSSTYPSPDSPTAKEAMERLQDACANFTTLFIACVDELNSIKVNNF